MKQELSILIPTYNDKCLALVKELCHQAEQEDCLLGYEIIVADDGSTDPKIVQENKEINNLKHCRYIIQPSNIGRSAIRNLLATLSVYPWLMFLDADMSIVSEGFLHNYLSSEGQVIYGGYQVIGNKNTSLRYRYEKKAEFMQQASVRNQHPYQDFHSSNFLIQRALMLSHPFDERFRYYGYEDVLLGKIFKENHIQITHIDNPVGFNVFETNEHFITKTEEALRTLHTFSTELKGYSRLLDVSMRINRLGLTPLTRVFFNLFKAKMRAHLCNSHPSLLAFKYYKLGYFISLTK